MRHVIRRIGLYLVAIWAAQRLGSVFPFGTLIVNLVGCFIIAAVMHAALMLGWSATLGHLARVWSRSASS